jgi:16S rRNA (adenine1518-N6/adenine1519-N6)-dimethyltransferase
MNLNEIKHVLDSERIQLTKSLGQNFLHDANQVRRLVEAAELSAGDRVLEIGPGLGAITQRLLERGMDVLALEKDRRLCDVLQARWPSHPQLRLVNVDAIDYFRRQPTTWADWKMVSNLPYSAASSILVELAKGATPPSRMVVTLQWEVAQRLTAVANDDDYGVLTLLVQVRFLPLGTFKIPPGCFFPVPDVESAGVILLRRPTPLVEPGEFRTFEKLVKRGFSQRRKMMMKLLKADWPLEALAGAFAASGVTPDARAETVRLDQFVQLTKILSHGRDL